MTETPVSRLVSKLAIPTIISMLVTSFYNLADTAFVSQLGTQASGAVGVVFSLMAFIQALGFTMGLGSGNFNSRLLGAKERSKANMVISTTFFTAFVVGLLITIFGLIFLRPFMRLLGASETILPYAIDYARIILLGAPIMAASFVMNANLRFEGNAFLGMRGIATGAVLNVLLDPLFIFVFGMGIKGAAIATLLSQAVSFSILLYAFLTKQSNLHIHIKHVRLKWWIYKEVIRTGMPAFYRQGTTSLASVLLNISARGFGDAALASMAIVNRIMMFLYSMLIGFGQGFQPVAGFNWGAQQVGRVRKAYWFTFTVGVIGFVILGTVGYIGAPIIMKLFIRTDPDVVTIGSLAMRLQCLTMPIQAVSVVSSMLFQSVGRSTDASVTALSRHGLFFIPLVLVLPNTFGILGLQATQPLADVGTFLLTLVCIFRFLRKLREMPQIPHKSNDSEQLAIMQSES